MEREASAGTKSTHQAGSRSNVRVIVIAAEPAGVVPLLRALTYVDCLPLLAVSPAHGEQLADCHPDAVLVLGPDNAALSLADPTRTPLRTWSTTDQSDFQLALNVREELLAYGRTRAVRWGDLELRPRLFQATWRGQPLTLSPLQLRLLTRLAAARGEVVSRREIAARVFGDDLDRAGDRLDSHVRRLRSLLEDDPACPRFLLTVRGEGLRLAGDEEVTAAGKPGRSTSSTPRAAADRRSRDVIAVT